MYKLAELYFYQNTSPQEFSIDSPDNKKKKNIHSIDKNEKVLG